MGSPVSSSSDSGERRATSQRVWTVLVILLAMAVVFVMTYPLVSTLISPRNSPPNPESTTVEVSERLANLSAEQRLATVQGMFLSPNPLMRQAVVEAIEDYKMRDAFALLERSLEDNCSTVRRRGMEALWKQERQRALPLVLAGLKDVDTDIRRAALNQLRFSNDPRVVPAIVPLLDDPDPTVRFFATGVLRKFTGIPYIAKNTDPEDKKRQVVQQWKQWWSKNEYRWKDTLQWAKVNPILPKRTDPAPPLRVKTLDGKRISLSDLKGKVVVLHFYATWCAPCEQELPHFVRLRQAYPPQQVAIVGLAVNETDGGRTVREWIKRLGLNFPQALASPAIVSAYWVQGVPITYILDTQGRIRYRFEGERDYASLQRLVDYLLQEVSATNSPTTPALER